MISKNLFKNKAIIIAIISFAFGALIYNYSSIIFQEGNPWPQIKGMVQLNFTNQDMVKLSSEENKYITKSKNDAEIIKSFMKDRGYNFTEQMGSGYLFRSSTGASAVATHKYYSRFYSLWKITENTNANNKLWITITTDDGITFQYPKELIAKYVSVAEWPPVIKIETGTYSCKITPQEISSMSDITSERMVDDRVYCVNIKHEGAAGSVYSSYTYTTAKNDGLIKVSFTLQYPNCNNYDEAQSKDCTSEREAFDIDSTVDRIVQTIKMDLPQEESLSDQIKKCIIMSDTASQEKCNELLATIRNYDDCINAGFSMMKSNPPQCATPDGKTFTQMTNSTWNMAKTAVANCEVVKAFQAHSRIVNLELKNGNKLIVIEPVIDDIIKIINEAETKCGRMPIATE